VVKKYQKNKQLVFLDILIEDFAAKNVIGFGCTKTMRVGGRAQI
jgi:hypothetical protein